MAFNCIGEQIRVMSQTTAQNWVGCERAHKKWDGPRDVRPLQPWIVSALKNASRSLIVSSATNYSG
jgi:hypothetical protein